MGAIVEVENLTKRYGPLLAANQRNTPFANLSGGQRQRLFVALALLGLLLTHVVTAMQNPWVGFSTDVAALAFVTGTLVVAAALSVRFLRWD